MLAIEQIEKREEREAVGLGKLLHLYGISPEDWRLVVMSLANSYLRGHADASKEALGTIR